MQMFESRFQDAGATRAFQNIKYRKSWGTLHFDISILLKASKAFWQRMGPSQIHKGKMVPASACQCFLIISVGNKNQQWGFVHMENGYVEKGTHHKMPTIVFKKGHVVIHPDILASMDLSSNEEYPQMSLFHIFEMAKWPTLCCSIPILSNKAISYSPYAHPVPQAAAKGLLAGLKQKKAKSKAKAKAVPVPKRMRQVMEVAADHQIAWRNFEVLFCSHPLGWSTATCHGNKPIKWRARAVFQEKGCLWPDNSTKSDHARLTKRNFAWTAFYHQLVVRVGSLRFQSQFPFQYRMLQKQSSCKDLISILLFW